MTQLITDKRTWLILGACSVMIILGGCIRGTSNVGTPLHKNEEQSLPLKKTAPISEPISVPDEGTNKVLLPIATISVLHPKKLTVTTNEYTITIAHAVPFPHPDPCDAKGGGGALANIKDFYMRMQLFQSSLKEAIDSEYVIFQGDTPVVDPGFIDRVVYRKLAGYRIERSIEGCGDFTYYFPLSDREILVITRPFVSEFRSSTFFWQEMHKQYELVPGIILPAEEEALFSQIVSSIQFKNL